MTRGVAIFAALAGAALAAASALALRYLFIEPAAMGQVCLVSPAPWWCPLRDFVVRAFRAEGFGFLALAMAGVALFLPGRVWGVLAVFAGVFGLVLYNAGLGAVGLLVGLLRLIRP
ncbi:MAG: hypothetical protein ACKVSF_02845 [Alphaproteobacteria bacterium]